MKSLTTICCVFLLNALFSQSFTTNTTSGCAPLSVDFTNTTGGSGNTYSWSFGDGGFSSQISPSYTYTTPGNYAVVLDVWNALGQYVGYAVEYIDVLGPAPTIQISKDTVCVGETVDFWENAQANSYEIDFGDGSPTETNSWGSFNHEYTSSGMYIVNYTYYTSCGNGTVQDTVWVGNNVPVNDAYIQVSSNEVCPGDVVGYWTNWDYSWVIDFGDGNQSSTEWDHSYAQPGTYTVITTVQNACGNVGTATETIVVSNNVYIPNWVGMYIDDPVCPGEPIYFEAENGFTSYQWDFGGGNTSSTSQAYHSYPSDGQYNVSVTITNGCGNDTTLYDVADVSSNLYINYAEIELLDSICLGEPMQFDFDGDDDLTYMWDFDDGNTATTESGLHTYQNAGVYNVTVTAENACGNDTTLTAQVYVGSNVGFNLNNFQVSVYPEEACPGDTVIFFSSPGGVATNYSWDFGDGSTANGATDGNTLQFNNEISLDFVKYAYASQGTYEVVFTAQNACGYTYTDTFSYDVGPGAEIEASLIYNTDVYNCLGAPVTFWAAGGSTYTWDFGDGTGNLATNATLVPQEHIFQSPGSYEVTLTATNQCGNTDETSIEIVIPDNSIQLTTTSIESNCGVDNGTAVVSISGGDGPFSIEWSNGDIGNVADSLSAGVYQVTIYDANGCTAEAVATVSDEEAPTILLNAQQNVTCAGYDNGAIDVNLIGSSAPYTYAWSNGSSGEDVHNLPAGPHELVVTDANGCVAAKSFEITEPFPSNLTFTNTKSTCGQDNGTSTVNISGDNGPYLISWQNGSSNPTIGGLSPGVYTVSVIDSNGCLISGQTTISETNAPFIILDSLTQDGCGGSLASIYINPIGGQAPYNVAWSNGTNNEDLLNVQSGVYNVIVTGNNGCSSVASYEITEFTPDPLQLCMVTVDPWTSTNLVVWEKDNISPAIKSFNIYKESSQSGVYYPIANVSVDSLSQYVDPTADPMVQAWRYKIAALDSCGNESYLSTDHTSLHLTSNQGISGEVNLIWSHYVGFSYSTYNIWRYTDVDGWNMIQSMANTNNSFTDINVPVGALSLSYYVEALPDIPCVSSRANHNTTRSNRTNPINGDDFVPPLNISEENELDVSVYPNPTNGELNIRVDNVNMYQLQIIDLQGKVVLDNAQLFGVTQLDISHLSNGLYNIRVYTNDKQISKRIILQR